MSVSYRGPIFDGRAELAVKEYIRQVSKKAGERGVEIIRQNLDGVLRHQTGHYRGSIQATGINPTRINDGGIIYGPWLEGVGSRNRTTRFKGYFTFRRSAQQIDRDAGMIAEAELHRYIGRMQ